MDSDGKQTAGDASPAPRSGLRLMIIILIAMALVAIYANVQKARRNQIESVIITPAASATPAPAAAAP